MKASFLFFTVILLSIVISISGFAQSCPDSVVIPDTIYVGTIISAAGSPAGGTWTSSNTTTAAIGSNTGTITGIAAGTAMITYSLDTCFAAKQITVVNNSSLPGIGGNSSVCVGSTTTLTNAISGGTWSMSSLVAGINSSTGVVTASNTYAGTATVTYTAGGISTTAVITVNPNPTPIQGPTLECAGTTVTLTDATVGGSWSGTGDATVSGTGSSGTLITGAVAGTAMVTYTLATGCMTTMANIIHANPLPIQGTFNMCMGSVTELSDASTGLSWSSSNTAVAVASGPDITAESVGTAIITFTSNTAGYCIATQIVTVSPQPAGITGNTGAICPGATLSLTDGSGVWVSSNVTIASVGSASGIVTGVTGGKATITFLASGGAGCMATTTVTIYAVPAITGTATLCMSGMTTLADAVNGGTWSSGSPGIATVDATGVVAGVAGGTAIITYTTATGCTTTLTVTVSSVSMAINGNLSVCQGGTTTLSDASAGGIWSMSSFIASVAGSTGVVTASSGYTGTATISYTSGGCLATRMVTVNAIPTPIQGATSACAGTTITLTDATAGGTWSGTGDATVSGTGSSGTLAGGAVGGTVTVTYTMPTGCMTTKVNTIRANPLPIGGTLIVCVGSVTVLTDASPGLSWSSSNTVVAVASGPVITGASVGTAIITFTSNTAGYCIATQIVTVSPQPAGITGNIVAICPVTTLSLEDGAGVWSSSNTAIATVGSISGIVTGMTGGTATITYIASGAAGCLATTTVTVSTVPVISGTATLCMGGMTALVYSPGGGVWSSQSPGIATVNATGNVTGITAGTAAISYTVPIACSGASAIVIVTVNPLPDTGTITGPLSVCAGAIINLTDGSGGGIWSSGSTSIATVGSTGNVTGITAGTVTISYTVSNSCGTLSATIMATVKPLPDAGTITGPLTVCAGSITNLIDGAGGGIWSSGSTSVATVGSTGITGITAGTATISYAVTNSCGSASATVVVTVNPLPDAGTITGPLTVCTGSTINLTDGSGSGIWNSGSPGIATVGSTGIVTGIITGTATISYTVTNSCGSTIAIQIVTVNTTTSSTITGPSSVILGSSVNLSDTIAGGVWSASNGNATVSGGVVYGVAPGTVTISYAITGPCGTTYATKVITVTNLCYGTVVTMTPVTPGGTWSMVSLSATITSAGVLTAATGYPGTATVTYTLGGVHTYIVVTVYPNPTPIQCSALICTGVAYLLSDVTGAGQWSGSGDGIVSGTGSSGTFVAGAVAGTAILTYTLPTGCIATLVRTVYSNPPPIAGTFALCSGASTNLTDASPLSSWKSSDTSVAKFSGSSLVGQNAGTSTITFTTSAAGYCMTTQVVTVNALPAAITGNTGAICPGLTLSLIDGTGTWTSSNTAVAKVGADGTITGVAGGTSLINYLAGGTAGCTAKTIVTVNSAPAITGIATTCPDGTTALHDALGGGTWSSGAPGIATVNTAGAVTGIADGNANITYTTSTGCNIVQAVNVAGVSVLISGNLSMCQGSITTLSDASVGGAWSMSSGLVTINGITGIMTASASLSGTSTVTYTSGSCTATSSVTVNVNPTAIQGAGAECAGLTTSLSDVTAGGTWSISGDASLTGTSGTVTGLLAGGTGGTASVTYTLPTGCTAKSMNTIYALPQPIQGNFNLCVGLVTYLSDASPANSWSSSSTAIAVASGPDITGEGAGVATITFKSGAAGYCITTQTVTVNVMPVVTAINGPATISHAGSPVSLSDATGGGIWASSNTSVITLSGSTGSPIGATAVTTTGSSVITYAVTILGCTTKVTKTFSAAASSHPDGGNTTFVNAGSAVSIADDISNGSWSSSNSGIASVDANGTVTGIMPGNVTITHEATGNDGAMTTSVTNVIVSALPALINVFPNPNKGTFAVRGTVGTVANEAVTLDVTDLLGQVIYRSNATAFGGRLDETITLSDALANGMYILNVKAGTENKTFHFVIER